MDPANYEFTLSVSAIPSDFFETHTAQDEISRMLDSRYWEARVPSVSFDLAKQVCSCTSTLDLNKSIE